MDNLEAADILDDIGDLLEIKGESSFRVQAYHRAAHVIRSLPQDINLILKQKEGLRQIKGVGKGLAERLEELLTTGKMSYYQELKSQIPPSLAELIKIQGLGPKKAKLVFDDLGISTVEQLEIAAKNHKLAKLPGFGLKTEENILRGIALYQQKSNRLLLNQAMPVAEKVIEQLKKLKEVQEISAAGSLRRWQETIGDVDILVGTDNPKPVGEAFCLLPDVKSVLGKGETKCSVVFHNGLQIDLRLVKTEEFGSALQYFTGSKAHNIHLREIAKKRGLKLSEYGVFTISSGKRLASRTEKEVYQALGLPYIEPVLRENKGEIEAAQSGKLPNLIKLSDIKGDLHVHTQESDGQSSLEELASFAKTLGYQYLGLSDHAEKLKVAHGLDKNRFLRQWQQIDNFNKANQDLYLLKAVELNIDNYGLTDFDDEFLSQFDIVTASIHTGFNQNKDEITARIISAIRNPHIDIIGHPTGRIIDRRSPYPVDLPKIFAEAAKTKTILELNAFPDRLDLNDDQLREASRMGIKFAINTDAHHYGQLAYIRYGLATAQRGWIEPDMVINTWQLEKLLNWLKKR
jgi:DNA polymerase (family 10)